MKNRKAISVLGVLAVGILLSGWACNDSQYHKANRASKQIADDIHEFQVTVTRECSEVAGHCTGRLGDEEAIALTRWVVDATRVSDEFNRQLKASKDLGGTQSQVILQAFNNLVVSVNNLNSSGALHIQNKDSQKLFQDIYNSTQAALSLLQTILSSPTSEKPSPATPLRANVDPMLAIAALLSLLRLIAQFKLDGELTDEQLQAAVEAENEDTRTMASDLLSKLQPKP